jgi:hyperosmotically inducible periplasmic protein
MNNDRRRVSLFLIAALILPMLLTACGKTVSETIDDATITARVKTALLNDQDIEFTRIDVDTVKGVVSLSGRVTSKEQQERAVAIARKVDGVRDVKSTLQIQPL